MEGTVKDVGRRWGGRRRRGDRVIRRHHTMGPRGWGPAVPSMLLCVVVLALTLPVGAASAAAPGPTPDGWELVAPMGTPRVGLAAASDGERLYAVGGRDASGSPMASAEAYDPDTNAWTPLSSMAAARADHALVAASDGRLYAIGGNRKSITTVPPDPELGEPDVEVYDPAVGSWTALAPPALTTANPETLVGRATGRHGLAAVAAPDGRIYAMGGTDVGDQAVAAVEVFDPAQPQLGWVDRAPMPRPRVNFGAAVGFQGASWRIYVLGGANTGNAAAMKSVEAYDPVTNTWTAVASMPDPRALGPRAAADTAGRVYAVGGWWGMPQNWEDRGDVDVYDPSEAAPVWKPAGRMSTPRENGAAAAGPDGRIYALGGSFGTDVKSSVEAFNPSPDVPESRTVADFDGDGDTDVSVFRPQGGTWFVKDGDTVAYGTEGDIPVPADYDGDKTTDVAIFRPSVGLWAIHRSSDDTDVFVTYGIGTDVPVPADYDGDAKADIAIFRPEFATWWVRHSSTGLDAPTTFGIGTDTPVPADYDGDAKADIAVFRNGTWFTLPSRGGSYLATSYGNPGDIPVPADYDADGVIDRAVFRPSDGSWSLHRSSDDTEETLALGLSGDLPVPGDYHRDRSSDPAAFRPSTGQWSIESGETHAWGLATDMPLPLPHAIWLNATNR